MARKASERIRNADGSIYHLHLFPDQVADTVLTVGDPDRVEMVSKYFDRIEYKGQKREFVTHTGTIGNKRFTVISTGIGTDNIDIVLNELHLLKHFDPVTDAPITPERPMRFIRLGTSGSIQEDIPLHAVLFSTFGVGIDNLMHFYAYTNTAEEEALLEKFKLHCYFHHTIHPYVFAANAGLMQLFAPIGDPGISLTAPGFYGPQGRKVGPALSQEKFYSDIISFQYGDKRITNFEMETAAMYGLSSLLGHPCISLNVILANRANGTFSSDPHAATEAMIRAALEQLASED